ncbi:hypothetical protein GJ496_002980 [Pomphorhynchus laevis]|nr:hypothetical protein GJ496_002980 [Pomphorhynchus laevis]
MKVLVILNLICLVYVQSKSMDNQINDKEISIEEIKNVKRSKRSFDILPRGQNQIYKPKTRRSINDIVNDFQSPVPIDPSAAAFMYQNLMAQNPIRHNYQYDMPSQMMLPTTLNFNEQQRYIPPTFLAQNMPAQTMFSAVDRNNLHDMTTQLLGYSNSYPTILPPNNQMYSVKSPETVLHQPYPFMPARRPEILSVKYNENVGKLPHFPHQYPVGAIWENSQNGRINIVQPRPLEEYPPYCLAQKQMTMIYCFQ